MTVAIWSVGRSLCVVLAGLLASQPSRALEITFEAVDLQDRVTNEDLWEIQYRLDAFPLGQGFGFSIEFDRVEYESLALPAQSPPGWDVLVIQPDLQLAAPGYLDVLALRVPDYLGPFAVEFVWKGSGMPSRQSFTVYDPSFTVVETGLTAQVPEPGSALMVLMALCVMSRRIKR